MTCNNIFFLLTKNGNLSERMTTKVCVGQNVRGEGARRRFLFIRGRRCIESPLENATILL
jgi:hypothetical protein